MKTIYIADDDHSIVESMQIVLESQGYRVEAQYDDINIVNNIKRLKPDCILLDVIFPEDDSAGFRMAREIRADDVIKDIPLIMLSAVNEKGSYAGTFSNRDRDQQWLPVDEFIEKPLEPAALLEIVNKYTS
jgi:CheY-like chemotaxis protein